MYFHYLRGCGILNETKHMERACNVMICPKCGKALPEHSNYCNYCGAAVKGKKEQKKSYWKLMVVLILLIIFGSSFSDTGNNVLSIINDQFRKNITHESALNTGVEDAAISEEFLWIGYDQVFSERGLWDSSNVDSCLDRISYIKVIDDDGTEKIEKIEFGHRDGKVVEMECSFYCSTADILPDEMAAFVSGERAFYEMTYGEPDNAIVRSTHLMNYSIVQITYKELDKSDNAKAVMNTLECYGPGISDAADGKDYIPVPSASDYSGWYVKQIAGN